MAKVLFRNIIIFKRSGLWDKNRFLLQFNTPSLMLLEKRKKLTCGEVLVSYELLFDEKPSKSFLETQKEK